MSRIIQPAINVLWTFTVCSQVCKLDYQTVPLSVKALDCFAVASFTHPVAAHEKTATCTTDLGGNLFCLRACPWNEARNETAHVTNGNCAGKEGEEPGFRDDLCSPGRGVPVSAAASLSWPRCACIRFSLHILLDTLHRVHRHLPSDDFLVSAEHTSTQTSHAKCCLEKSRNLDT